MTQIVLYHGTNACNLKSILTDGLKPRSQTGINNWRHMGEHRASVPDLVYLTDTYPLFFANAALVQQDKKSVDETMRMRAFPVVLEMSVDTECLYPDEDFLAWIIQKQFKFPYDEACAMVTTNDGGLLHDKKKMWDVCLKHQGTVAHMGVISPSAITRVAIVRDFPLMMFGLSDHGYSTNIHPILGPIYRAKVKWVFGDGHYHDADGFPAEWREGREEPQRDGIDVYSPPFNIDWKKDWIGVKNELLKSEKQKATY